MAQETLAKYRQTQAMILKPVKRPKSVQVDESRPRNVDVSDAEVVVIENPKRRIARPPALEKVLKSAALARVCVLHQSSCLETIKPVITIPSLERLLIGTTAIKDVSDIVSSATLNCLLISIGQDRTQFPIAPSWLSHLKHLEMPIYNQSEIDFFEGLSFETIVIQQYEDRVLRVNCRKVEKLAVWFAQCNEISSSCDVDELVIGEETSVVEVSIPSANAVTLVSPSELLVSNVLGISGLTRLSLCGRNPILDVDEFGRLKNNLYLEIEFVPPDAVVERLLDVDQIKELVVLTASDEQIRKWQRAGKVVTNVK